MISSAVPIPCPLAFGFDNPYLIQQSLEQLMGPVGLLAMLVGALMLMGVIAYKRIYWVVMALLLFTSTVTSHTTETDSHPYSGPLQIVAEQGRNLVLGFLLILLVPSLITTKGTRGRLIHSGLLAYLTFELLYTFEIAASRTDGSVLRLVIGVMLHLLTFGVFAFGLSKMLQTMDDAVSAVKVMAWSGVIFAFVTAVELLISPKSVVFAGRLWSLAGTATFCAELLVAVMLPTLYLILRGDTGWLARYFWCVVFGTEGLMLIGTGTRTGLVMLFVGLAFMLRSRMAKLFPLALGTAIVVGTALMLLPEDLGIVGAERMLSVEDTRSDAWHAGLDAFTSAPFFGISVDGQTILIENSYIDALAQSGLVGVVPFAVAFVLFVRSCVMLYTRRSRLDRQSQFFVDFLVGAFAAEMVGGMFDAYLLATVSVQLYVITMLMTLSIFVLDRMEQSESTVQPMQPPSVAALSYDPAYAI